MKPIRILALFIITLVASPIPVIGEEKKIEKKNPYQSLGVAVAEALAAKDFVAYCSCWDNWRQLVSQIEKMREAGEDFPEGDDLKEMEKELKEQRSYQRERNENITFSFKVIMDALKAKKVDPASIKLKEISANGRRDQGEFKRVGGYKLVLSSNRGEIVFDVDDGAHVDGRWYFTDSPNSIKIGGEHYHLHTKPYDEKRTFNPDKEK